MNDFLKPKRKYAVQFENKDTGVVLNIENIYADHVTAAQFEALQLVKDRNVWECIGIDRMND